MTVCRSGAVTLVCVGVTLLLVGSCKSGCREADACCAGRDPSCVSRGWRSDRSFGSCHCDQACVTTLDCCHDYAAACPAVSCVVSEWTKWSGCAEPCRASVRRRSRSSLQEHLNAGKPCPHLEEHAGCAEYWSQHGHCHSSLVPALITTGGYGNSRKKRNIPDGSDITGYCVQFQLMSMTKGCQQSAGSNTHWMQHLREGHHVCVDCQPPALAAGQKHCAGDGEKNNEDERSIGGKSSRMMTNSQTGQQIPQPTPLPYCLTSNHTPPHRHLLPSTVRRTTTNVN